MDIFIDFRERRQERERQTERERERNIDGREKHRSVDSCTCPDQGTNPQSFGVWDQKNATWPGVNFVL